MAKVNLNKEQDEAARKGLSSVNREAKVKAERKEKLKNEEVKVKSMDYIFGKTDVNPLDS